MNQIINGRYRVIERLGQGAFGAVYLAEHIPFGNKVVVKLSTEARSEYEDRAFKREALAAAGIRDPHIAAVFDAGITEDGHNYIVREYVEGRTVDTLLESEGTLPLGRALEISLAVAKGLKALHRHGIIHRDIKPNNIIVAENTSEVKILDLGVMGKLEQSTGQTMAGQIFGTPNYMAPEQMFGDEQSPTVDIYSLGSTLFEMIYGRLPFVGGSLPELINNKLKSAVSFPTNVSLPDEVVSFIRRCLSASPAGRPQSADEVIAEMLKLLERLTQTPILLTGTQTSVGTARESADCVRMTEDVSVATAVTHDDISLPVSSVEPSARARTPISVPAPVIAILATLLATIAWFKWGARYQVLGLVTGALYIVGGILVGRVLRAWLKARRGEVQLEAGGLLLSSKSRESLSTSLAIEVDRLIYKVSRLDDKILATSLAIMVREFQEAREAQFRQAAIMNVVQLLEKLTNRLSPWYVRHEKLLALTVTMVGILSGLTTVTKSIVEMTKGK